MPLQRLGEARGVQPHAVAPLLGTGIGNGKSLHIK